MKHAVEIEFEDDLLLNVGMSAEQFSREARFLLAAKLYELGRITSGKAAQLCGRTRVGFLMALSEIGVPASNLRPEDVEYDIRFGRDG
jgi:predicted HTH domain antitoxin